MAPIYLIVIFPPGQGAEPQVAEYIYTALMLLITPHTIASKTALEHKYLDSAVIVHT